MDNDDFIDMVLLKIKGSYGKEYSREERSKLESTVIEYSIKKDAMLRILQTLENRRETIPPRIKEIENLVKDEYEKNTMIDYEKAQMQEKIRSAYIDWKTAVEAKEGYGDMYIFDRLILKAKTLEEIKADIPRLAHKYKELTGVEPQL